MKFGRVAVAAGEGLILAHAVKGAGIVLRKGEIIGPDEIAALESAGITSVIGAQLEDGDVVENLAALRLAERVAGRHITLERPFTGRCNLLAEANGLVLVDATVVDAVNAVDEAITLATVAPMQPTAAGEMVATVKIIPFAVGGAFLDCRAGCRQARYDLGGALPASAGRRRLDPAAGAEALRHRQDPRHSRGKACAGLLADRS